MVDASPQLGMSFLCVREDRIRLPRAELGLDFRKAYDLNSAFETRICPLSTLGLGHAGLVKKAINVANVYLMEAETLERFHEARQEVVGYLSDQGTEKKVAELTVGVIPRCRDLYEHSDPMSYMYPRCLAIPGHLHILYNALEESIKSLPIADKFLSTSGLWRASCQIASYARSSRCHAWQTTISEVCSILMRQCTLNGGVSFSARPWTTSCLFIVT